MVNNDQSLFDASTIDNNECLVFNSINCPFPVQKLGKNVKLLYCDQFIMLVQIQKHPLKISEF